MRSLVKLSFFFTFATICMTHSDLEKRDNVTLKAPIIAVPSQHWEGVDGTWSTFEIRVGTPANVFRVLPVTSWQETWVVYGLAADVCNASAGVAPNCQDARGGVFNNDSSTWEQGGEYNLGVDAQLGYEGEGQYGFDTVGLGYDNSTGPTLSHQVVAAIVSDDWWFGMLGLGFQPTNFSGYGNPQASFSDTLYSNGSISSMSWSYTAGAYYRLKSVFGSLIFGGYDASRFVPNDVTFTMTGDALRDVVLTISSITSTTASGNRTLMSTPEFAFIDSAVPEIWLPVQVCQQFESAFGITLDNATGLYLLNSSTHEALQTLNPNITFTLSDQKSGGSTIDLVLPYSAFDLNVTSPILTNKTSFYFPIRQATDDTQYTLGRTFLQEVYVTADYNSRTFNVSQCIFDETATSRVIAIPSNLPSSSSSPSPSSSGTSSPTHHKLSGGAIAGIVIGSIAGIVLILLALLLLLRRRRQRNEDAAGIDRKGTVHEIDPGTRVDPKSQRPGSQYSGQASAVASEADGHERLEIEGNPIMVPQELEAEVPPGVGTSVGGLRTIKETKTPMAELEEREKGLGAGVESERERESEEEHIVSPNTDTLPSMMQRENPEITVSSPVISEATWSPSSPVKRRGSKFEERLDD